MRCLCSITHPKFDCFLLNFLRSLVLTTTVWEISLSIIDNELKPKENFSRAFHIPSFSKILLDDWVIAYPLSLDNSSFSERGSTISTSQWSEAKKSASSEPVGPDPKILIFFYSWLLEIKWTLTIRVENVKAKKR